MIHTAINSPTVLNKIPVIQAVSAKLSRCAIIFGTHVERIEKRLPLKRLPEISNGAQFHRLFFHAKPVLPCYEYDRDTGL